MRVRYWLSAGVCFFALAAVAAMFGALVPRIGTWTPVLIVAMVYPLLVAFDLLPPGLPNSTHHRWPQHLPRRQRPTAEALAARRNRVPAPKKRPRPYTATPELLPMHPPPDVRFGNGMFAVAVFSVLAVALVFARYSVQSNFQPDATPAMVLSGEWQPPAPEGVAGVQPPASAAVPSAQPASTEVPPTPTPLPPTATPESEEPTPAPTEPPRPAPTPNPVTSLAEALQAGWMTGRWAVLDVIKEGPNAGESALLIIDLQESGGQVTGQGSELELTGTHDGPNVRLNFRRADGSGGRFEWVIQADGSVAGTFEDAGGTIRGVSVGKREN